MTLRRPALIFSLNCFMASLLALYIAFSVGLPRPYWAMLTVYITSQPMTGALRSKAVFRLLGTIGGGVAAVVIVPTFVNAPVLMSLVMAGWVGLCLYISLLDRTPRSYVFMLAGYTAAIIGFPSVGAHEAIFDTALARVEEIGLGIVCATVVHTIVFPRDVGGAVSARVAGFIADSQAWIGEALGARRPVAERRDERRLAADISELHITATHLPFDATPLISRIRAVQALEGRLADMLPLISALEDRLAELSAPDPDLAALLNAVVAWAEGPADAVTAEDLRARAAALMPVIGPASPWRDLLTVSVLTRLDDLIGALQDARDLAQVMGGDAPAAARRVRGLLGVRGRRALHFDRGMAALSGLSLVAAVLVCCTLWIELAWPEGAVAAMMAAVFSSFFATQDDPAPAIGAFLTWTIATIPLGAIYLFAILPAVDGFPMLALTLAPALLAIGYFMALPRTAVPALAVLLAFVGGIALQPTLTGDLPDYLNGNLAQCVGTAVALVSARLLRSVGAGWAARRILKRGWRDIAVLAGRSRAPDPAAWSGAMLDRVGLVSARAGLAGPEDGLHAHDLLADMRVGLNMIQLKTAMTRAQPIEARAVNEALDGVADIYRDRVSGRSKLPAPFALNAIDRAIAALARAGDSSRSLAALVGLRRTLFPGAAPYQAQPVEGEA